MVSPNEGTRAIEWIKIAVIPVSIALGGWLFALISSERALDAGEQALRAEYVQIATDILSEPLPNDEEREAERHAQESLRAWAVDILAFGSPVAIDEETQDALRSGDASLPSPDCHVNYGGCVPIASDVDCLGSNLDGPIFIEGPVEVLGPDVYGLDRDHDGVGCETRSQADPTE